jgi:hypothetical protein
VPLWEYRIEEGHYDLGEQRRLLASMGSQGWEVFAVRQAVGAAWFYFKRVRES